MFYEMKIHPTHLGRMFFIRKTPYKAGRGAVATRISGRECFGGVPLRQSVALGPHRADETATFLLVACHPREIGDHCETVVHVRS